MMMKPKEHLILAALVASAVLLGGCGANFVNLTAVHQNQNPSNIYTLQTEVDVQDKAVVQETVQVSVVIAGQTHPMVRGQIGESIWSYDYKLPPGFDEANYYYTAEYQVLRKDLLKPRVIKSRLYRFQLENRYVGNLLAYRAPIGSKIAVQGRGFTKFDKVHFGSEAVETTYLSDNELQFVVPALPSGIDYSLILEGGAGKLPIGDFRIDESEMRTTPRSVEVTSGDVVTLLFQIPFDAPAGGMPVKIETDVATSVIMPDVRIPQGAKSISAPVKGGVPGSGSLFVNVPGIKELVVPVTVTAVPGTAPVPDPVPFPAPVPAPAPEPVPAPVPAPAPEPQLLPPAPRL